MKWIGILLFALITHSIGATTLPRTVIALYSEVEDDEIFFTDIHGFAQFPINHLGVRLEYYDVNKTLPNLKEREDVLGVLTWFRSRKDVKEPSRLLEWAIEVLQGEKKWIILGDPGFGSGDPSISLKRVNQFWHQLGLEDTGEWVDDTYRSEIVFTDPALTNFERSYKKFPNGFRAMKVVGEDVYEGLVVVQNGDPKQKYCLLSVGKKGSAVCEGYAIFKKYSAGHLFARWYINPFLFFEKALGITQRPVPDITMLAGRRIYYSHIDGDGWNSLSLIPYYYDKGNSCARVILEEIVKKFPDMPLSIGPIGAELDRDWSGTEEGRKIAYEMFLEPHIEAACHTFSHPFDWGFFTHYLPESEWPYLTSLQKMSWDEDYSVSATQKKKELLKGYTVPRGFAKKPFDVHLEVFGGIEQVNKVCPKGKKAEVYLWSGNCRPFESAIAGTRKSGVYNLNGGDTRFDLEYDSYAFVKPFSRQVGSERQIYSSASNENTYTNNWRDKFWGFRNLIPTLKNTDSPRRVQPINVYYHSYSGEREVSLDALVENIEYSQSQKICPIWASQFAAIVEGFYSCDILKQDDGNWKIANRGALQTIRFDRESLRAVDFERSKGVIGQCYLHGSLYVYLDADVETPAVVLKERNHIFPEPKDEKPYLVESRWRIRDLKREKGVFSFSAEGFGNGEMIWQVPQDGSYEIRVLRENTRIHQETQKTDERFLTLNFPFDSIEGVRVEVRYEQ